MPQTILLFTDWYEPGYKAGGPIRSCSNFVHQMKDDYSISVFTTDRDLNETEPYQSVVADAWVSVEKNVKVYYCSPANLSWKNISCQVKKIQPDFIYLNSMYSRYFTLYPLLMKKLGITESKVVLSPRGMLKESALQFKSKKKKIFLSLFKGLGLHRKIHFHATDATEELDIARQFGARAGQTMIPNFPAKVEPFPGSLEKMAGALKIIFVGRLHPIKNLDYLLQLLPHVKGNVTLTIIGSEENAVYVAECKKILADWLPGITVKVRFAGEIPNDQLPAILADHHILALPTRGENFGHAIFEALKAGRPVLISDQTPWRGLTNLKAGWDLPLDNKKLFLESLQQAIGFDQQEYDVWCRAAWQHVYDYVTNSDLKSAYYKLFT